MAKLQALRVEFGAAFPYGVGMVGEVEQQNAFDPQAGTKRYKVKFPNQSPLPEPEPVGDTGLTLHPLPVGVA